MCWRNRKLHVTYFLAILALSRWYWNWTQSMSPLYLYKGVEQSGKTDIEYVYSSYFAVMGFVANFFSFYYLKVWVFFIFCKDHLLFLESEGIFIKIERMLWRASLVILVKNLPANAGETGSNPDLERSCMMKSNLSPCTTITKPIL